MKKALAVWVVLCTWLVSCQSQQEKEVTLWDGKGLDSWVADKDGASFKIEGEELVWSGTPGYLVWNGKNHFRDFVLEAELMTEPGAFGEILFHQSLPFKALPVQGYGVVVGNTPRSMEEPALAMKTGSLAGIRHLYFPMVADGEWFGLKIRVAGNHAETFINGVKVMDYIQPVDPWRSSESSGRLCSSGTFALHLISGTIRMRSCRVEPLPEGEPVPLKVEEAWDARVTQMMEEGFPLIDFHVHLKGGLTIEQAIENGQRLGINYGIAPNCGLKFPVTDDVSLAAYMDTVRGKPIFRGMQAEGREWITLFSPEAVAQFDYAFTDALTFTDARGRRNRLWIPEEVWVEDPEQFMDQLVGKIEAIMSQEPVDIYVNPTLLPDALMPDYDRLWTPDRVERVIRVLKENNIALEINARYRVPSAAIIKTAREAGLKFSFGTNNAAADLGQLEYCLEMINECGLTPLEMFLPPVHEKKPVLVKGLPERITG